MSFVDKLEVNIVELLEYLQDIIESAPKVPITGKSMVDKKEFNEVIDQIINYLPDQFKKAQWVMNEKDRILGDAQKEYETVKKETVKMMKHNVENHDIVKEAKIRGAEILALAQRDAKAIRIGSREYSNEILSELDKELEDKKSKLIQLMQKSFEVVAKEIDENMSNASITIKENIAELRNM
nr:ATPase [Clostridium gasigenes]